jgi:hypothetical protein
VRKQVALDDARTHRLRGWGRLGLVALVMLVMWPAIAFGLWLVAVWRTGVPW